MLPNFLSGSHHVTSRQDSAALFHVVRQADDATWPDFFIKSRFSWC